MDEKLFIRLKNNISEIARVSQLLNDFRLENNLPGEISNAIDLALDEILNNIINYGYDDKNEHEITVQIILSDNTLSMIIEDDGRPFNPLDVPEPNTEDSLEDRTVGGLGLYLVRNVMDNMQYTYENNKNVIKMIKNVRG